MLNLKKIRVLFFLLFILSSSYAQTDATSVYKKLERLQLHMEGSSWTILNYPESDPEIDKSVYENYIGDTLNLSTCRPCIVEEYDENYRLTSEGVFCGDCPVGWYKEYHRNGKVKMSGKYKKNPTGNWSDIYDRGYCDIRDGEWSFYTKKGKLKYTELWKYGKFIKQTPEGDLTEVFDVELTLDGKEIVGQKIMWYQVDELKLTPKYKNSNRDSELTIQFSVRASSGRSVEKEFPIERIENIEVQKMIEQLNLVRQEQLYFDLTVFSDDRWVRKFALNVEH